MSLRNPEFAHFFFVQEHFQRFTTTMHHRAHPAWYFVPVLAAGVAPWLFVIAAGWWAALRRPGPGFSPSLFLALWALVVFVFFSASSSKLPGYILPLVPALALLGGVYVARAAPRRMLVAQAAVMALMGLALAAAAPRLARVGAERLDLFSGAYSAALIAAGLALAAAGVVRRSARPARQSGCVRGRPRSRGVLRRAGRDRRASRLCARLQRLEYHRRDETRACAGNAVLRRGHL